MIVLFIKSDLIRHQALPGHTCPSCGKTDGMAMELHQRYAELGTGKVYPKGVFGVVHCLHCGYTLPASRWTDPLHQTYERLKVGYQTPRRYWSGAIRTSIGFAVGLVLFVGTLSFWGRQRTADVEQQQADFNKVLTRPTPGITLASIANGQPNYDVWRVGRVNGDTIWLSKYTGKRVLTNFFTETGWNTLPNSDFSSPSVAHSRTKFADKGLKRIEDVADLTKPYEGVVLAVLDK